MDKFLDASDQSIVKQEDNMNAIRKTIQDVKGKI
jgi:hypothetical protein